jgi:hypothetical protein
VDLLVRALSAGIDLARTSDGEDSESDTNNTMHDGSSNSKTSHLTNGKNNGNSDSDSESSSSDEGYVAADDSELDAEEERYMEGLEEAEVRTFTEQQAHSTVIAVWAQVQLYWLI